MPTSVEQAYSWEQPIRDMMASVFATADFHDITPSSESGSDLTDNPILEGKIRHRFGYDALAGCGVDISEFQGVVLGDDDDTVGCEHILMVEWENGDDQWYEPDSGYFQFDDCHEVPQDEDAAYTYLLDRANKIQGALNAALSE